jgi:hypothetical protein
MDVERTIEFILETQAKAETRMDGITKLIQQGMQLLLSFQTETNHKINALIDAQLRSEARHERLESDLQTMRESLQKLIDLQNPNGH